ncbi:MAG: flavin reductase family protein [Candidatus Baldrarchaeia archaeon]
MNDEKAEVHVNDIWKLLHPRLTVLVTARGKEGNINVMTVSWISIASWNPPCVAIFIAPERYTYQLIKESGEFVVNVPTIDLLQKVDLCGSVSGREIDKFKEAGLTPISSLKVKAPSIKECIAHLECQLIKEVETGDHVMLLGRVIAARANKSQFSRTYDIRSVKLVYYVGNSEYTTNSNETYHP